MKSSRKAFSLIELSIVILIIGILVAGVTQGSTLLTKMKVASARSQTRSSPVNSTPGIVTWLEATSEESFDVAETDDGDEISTWYDLNKQSTYKNNATQTLDARPTYRANCINSLACVRFDGTEEFLTTSQNYGSIDGITIFAVVNSDTSSAGTYMVAALQGLFTSGSAYKLYYDTLTPTYELPSLTAATSTAVSVSVTNLISVVDDKTDATTYTNGAAGTSQTTGITKSAAPLNIGAWDNGTAAADFFDGSIGEIIVFDRALKTEEREAIETYLAKKWGVNLN